MARRDVRSNAAASSTVSNEGSDDYHVCFKVETHNHPSAIEPYGGANTGLGAKPVCNTDVFCFAPTSWYTG